MAIKGYPHIELNNRGVPVIAGTRMKVQFIAVEATRARFTAEQIQQQHLDLSLAQIHCALAYYFDHRDQVERQIEEGERLAAELRPTLENPETRARLQGIKQALASLDDERSH